MRKIPATMATQHPDNAGAPFWDDGRPFIGVHEEIHEAVACFRDLNVGEYMWDWEGKHADAAVIDRLFSDYHEYFSQHQLGRDQFLTFRLPNIWEEKGYNLLQAMTVILSSEDFARDLKFNNRPLFEIILPMTERADQLIHMQKLFQKVAKFKSTEFTKDNETNTDYLEIIPLVESVESQLAVDDLLREFVSLHDKNSAQNTEYIRAFLACSDSALTSGLLAGIIGNKVALSRLQEFTKESGIPTYPILGAGSLLFRGGLAPDTLDRFTKEFAGVRTVTVQSAFRYDYPEVIVKKAITRLEKDLPHIKPHVIDPFDQSELIIIGKTASKYYKQSLDSIVKDLNKVFEAVPKRRDRRQHIGLLAYSRTTGTHTLPRAITFTASLYSIGIPPEFIGLGRALRDLKPEQIELLRQEYANISSDFEKAGRYYNENNLEELIKQNSAWRDIKTDFEIAKKILEIQLGPKSSDEHAHKELSSALVSSKYQTEMTKLITEMAGLRKSLG